MLLVLTLVVLGQVPLPLYEDIVPSARALALLPDNVHLSAALA